ncbi:hypothetical protein C0Q70_05481 [Pomacea canaliculata]|uniref:Uncharacterized protein n=1 Tax=Pomacea canaliculata TaxID=400727 RepID=A0A2T7PLA8_POMCA|nr:hypothetical protein C0Q70_05481 [Pomacea canaliculata]
MHLVDKKVGAIFDSRDIESQKAFEYGIIRHRQSPQREPYFKFNVTMDTVDTADTFQVASANVTGDITALLPTVDAPGRL